MGYSVFDVVQLQNRKITAPKRLQFRPTEKRRMLRIVTAICQAMFLTHWYSNYCPSFSLGHQGTGHSEGNCKGRQEGNAASMSQLPWGISWSPWERGRRLRNVKAGPAAPCEQSEAPQQSMKRRRERAGTPQESEWGGCVCREAAGVWKLLGETWPGQRNEPGEIIFATVFWMK